ncbi:MAG TPA: hypothetical protein VJU14_05600 [Solirubrobacterales bacterium]|nr:hypothetical protein [Solirubrobacterales bacterium]
MKKLGVLVAVFALCAIGAANASAAQFTASATGSLTGSVVAGAEGVQVFTTSGGQVKCTAAATTGEIKSVASEEQTVEVKYSGCTAFGFATVHITPAFYNFTANGLVHIEKSIVITVTGAGCSQTVHPQTVGTVTFITEANGHMRVTPHVKTIAYTSTGGLCGAAGNNGTYTGDSTVTRVGGGTLSFHP